MVSYTFFARGDPRITARHRTTLEISKEPVRTTQGDCIVATLSEAGLASLPEGLKRRAREKGANMILEMETSGHCERVHGEGDPSLTFESSHEMVVRRSRYVDGRTLMVNSDKAALDLDRGLVEKLRNGESRIRITITVD
jgi:hypothetical protein